MKRLTLVVLLLGMQAVTACESPSAPPAALAYTARRTSAAREAAMVPVMMRQHVSVAPDAEQLPCEPMVLGVFVSNRWIGGGMSTHLGVITSVVGFDRCVAKLPLGTGATITGQGIVTAANGDDLLFTFTMSTSPHGDGPFHLDDVSLIGGTGRFAHATGLLTGDGYVTGQTAAWEVSGVMSRPGS